MRKKLYKAKKNWVAATVAVAAAALLGMGAQSAYADNVNTAAQPQTQAVANVQSQQVVNQGDKATDQ